MKISKKEKAWYGSLFAVYFLLLVWVIIFKLQLSLSDITSVRSINLIPLNFGNAAASSVQLEEAVLNFLIFIPFGFLLSMASSSQVLPQMGFVQRCLLVIGLSFVFEVLQYILAIGVSDITDLLTNSIGGICGVGVHWAMLRLFPKQASVHRVCAAIFSVCLTLFFILALLLLWANR